MSTRDTRSPQLGRIARLMYVDVNDLEGLDGIPEADLRALHDQIADSYFAAGRASFARVAGLSKALPTVVAGKLAQRFLPPHLAAQVTVMLEPAKARDLVDKVSVPYLAELSLSLDPTRSKPVVQAIPARRIAEVSAELFRRNEHAAVAEFAGSVTLDGLRAALGAASGHDMLEVAPMLVSNDNLETALAELSPEQVDAILAAMIDDELWVEGDYLIDRLPPVGRRTVAARIGALDDDGMVAFRRAADAGDLGTVTTKMLERDPA